MLTCLWLSKIIPFPLIAGDRKYSASLAASLAATGVAVTFAGIISDSSPPHCDNLQWNIVPGKQRSRICSLLSLMPLVGARHHTSAYEAELRQALCSRPWDIIVVDSCAMGWVLAYRRQFPADNCAVVYVAHNHEESLTWRQWHDTKCGLWEYFYLLQNFLKTRRLERITSKTCDLITTNTEVDAALFEQTAPGVATVTITPGYNGPRVLHRQVTTNTPRAVVTFGSYRWSVKRANLQLFLDCVDAEMLQAGIDVRFVGDISADVRQALERRYRSARFTGFVEDPAPHLDARLGIVAEPIGGGFKHKLLDYIFYRIPVVALESCVVGLPDSVLRFVLTVPDLPALRDCIVSVIDDVARLDAMQQGAFDAAARAFDWADRGRTLHAAILATARQSSSFEHEVATAAD